MQKYSSVFDVQKKTILLNMLLLEILGEIVKGL